MNQQSMVNKQRIEPPLTQREIIRLEKALFEVLRPLALNKRQEMYNNICRFLKKKPKNIVDIERDIRKIFKSEDTKQIKRLVCIVYDFFDNDRKKTYTKCEKLLPGDVTTDYITRSFLSISLEKQCLNADNAFNSCLMKFEKALENSTHYIFNGKFVLKRHTGVQEIIDGMKASKHERVNSYIKEAKAFLQHKKPLCKESMKASIDALELFICLFTGKKDIKKGIENLERKGVDLHPAFMKAMENLYDFTSDEVRHPKQRPVQVDKETALFMLVACSAIINIIEARSPKKNSKRQIDHMNN